MIGETRFHKLLENLIKVVHMRGIYVLTQVSILSETSSVFQQCKNVDFLNLKGEMGIEWTQYLQGLRHLGIQYLSQSDDHLIWSWNEEQGTVTAEDSYNALVLSDVMPSSKWWHTRLWKCYIPQKI